MNVRGLPAKTSKNDECHLVQGTLLIRADANAVIGTGHVMRCLALAQSWRDDGGHAVFATVAPDASVRERLLKEAVEIIEIGEPAGTEADVARTSSIAREHDAAWVVVDGYQFGADYQRALKSAGLKVLFLDDYGHAAHYCADAVLNQNISSDESVYHSREPYTRLLLGTKYCLLRREFNEWRKWKRQIPSSGHRVLVTMGGSDPENFTPRAIEALNLIDDDKLEASVLVGGSNVRFESLERVAAQAGRNISLHRDVSNMADQMAWADVAISAAGTTCWELCLLGLPAIVVDLAENQKPVAQELNRRGCAIHMGGATDVSAEKLATEVKRLLRSRKDREAMSSRCRQMVDGRGANRVVAALRGRSLRLRPAEAKDSHLLFEWANDALVRAASFSSSGIPWGTHASWFAEKLQHDQSCILIAENEQGTPVGQIRFDTRSDGDLEVGLSIASAWRRQGLAVPLIKQAAELVSDKKNWPRLHAFVKAENLASVKAFEKGGFSRIGIEEVHGNEAVHLIYQRDPSNQT